MLITWGDLNISNNQATNRVIKRELMDLMSSKGFELIIDRPTHKKWDYRPGVLALMTMSLVMQQFLARIHV